ncbi:MAG: hypothetical protein HKN27_02090 [Silicimonas sp.]|nr:hypothetical protein [Silicimonas sp.]
MKKAVLKEQSGEIVECLTLTELCQFCGTETQWIVDLVAHDVLRPAGSDPDRWVFASTSILRARKASRLNRDLGINVAGIAMVLDLLDERDRLRRRLSRHEVD